MNSAQLCKQKKDIQIFNMQKKRVGKYIFRRQNTGGTLDKKEHPLQFDFVPISRQDFQVK